MARFLRFAALIACILFAGKAFAAGGACPSGANYTNPANPIGPNVTLASLGITNCYFIAANGSDANSGTSESTPWLHAPGMQNCSGNCSASARVPGVGFIFRGGDTWHFGNSSASPYAGVVAGCAANGTVSAGLCINDVLGTISNPIYYGVDTTWFTGASWVRPILTADNPPCNANTVNGTTCVSTTDFYGNQSFYVSGCPYQIGGSNSLVDVGSSKYVIVDDFELTGLCQNHVGQPNAADIYVRYGSPQGPLYFLNLYIHGASHLQYAAKNGSAGCTSSVVCTNLMTFAGGAGTGASYGETVAKNVVDFSDSDPGGQGTCFGTFYNVAYNVFRYTTQCVMHAHLFHDNLYEYFFENGHSNVLESLSDFTGTNAVYNNVFRHIEVAGGGGVGLWLLPPVGTTTYVFNNVMYDVGGLEYNNIGNSGTSLGTYTYFNNTFQSNVSQPIMRCDRLTGTLNEINNHYIVDGSSYFISGCTGTVNTTTPLLMTNATATTNGYTSSQTYAYSPISPSSPTVRKGTNTQSFCSALSTAAASDPTLSDAAWACVNATPYACAYNTSSRTGTCPVQTIAPRPTSAAWNVGTYQYGPNSPSNLAVTVQ